jgi:Domain of unknown function (DUF1929)
MRKVAAWIVLWTTAVAMVAVGNASAHGMGTPRAHAREDSVLLSPSTQAHLNHETKVTSAAASRADAVSGTPDEVGQWGPVVNWPVVAIFTSLLPNGKVLAYDSASDHLSDPDESFTRATVWDPATGSQTNVRVNTGYNIFCSGLAHLVNGTVFVAGGNKDPQFDGIVQTHLFDPTTNTWSLGPNMAAGRWYPSVTPMSNGEMLITSGGPDVPEVRRTDGSLRSLSSAALGLPLYPWVDVAPDGRAFVSGPATTLRSLNTSGTGSWTTYGQRDTTNRDYGSHAFYNIGKILVAGGGPSLSDARVIDINGSTPQVSTTSSMAFGRRQFNLTVLADGKVLATGGNSSGSQYVDMNAGVYPAERWNPATGNWKTLASMAVTRQYHSTALLLPDGRVLSAGGGVCGTCDQVGYLAKNAEIFTPPYLFKKDGSGQLAARPTISSAPSAAGYGSQIQIATPNASSIQKVALVRLGSVTHDDNMEQRYVPLNFTAGTSSLRATIPANVNVAPPGYYMLFIFNRARVPSVAKMVRLDPSLSPPPPPSAPTLTGTNPGSPANDNHPEVTGTLGTGNPTQVNIFENPSCSGAPAATGAPSTFTGSGLTIDVADDSSTSISATASNAGGDSACSNAITYVEATPPNTTITSAPPGYTNATSVAFGFASSEANSTFACRFDNAAAATPCASPMTYGGLAEGTHTFRVKATDPAANTDPTPAWRTFTVDATPPDTTITSGPSGTITRNDASFGFSASEAGSRFRCRLDSAAFEGCASPKAYSNLASGTHRFGVRAIDRAGNLDPTPAIRNFTVLP